MNKQAITFLSLFSLILVLSVYYILLPPLTSTDANIDIVSSDQSEIEILQIALDNKRNDVINENNTVIASTQSDNQKIQEALETISKTKDTIAKEKEIIEHLKGQGYQNSFVEISEKNIKVVVEKTDGTISDANAIIKNLLSIYNSEYQVEVKFVAP